MDGLFEEIAKIGEASVRRIYGDFSNPRSKGWADTLSKHAIIPQQQFAYTTGIRHHIGHRCNGLASLAVGSMDFVLARLEPSNQLRRPAIELILVVLPLSPVALPLLC